MSERLRCEQAQEALTLQELGEELPLPEAAALSEHLARCRACRDYRAGLADTIGLLGLAAPRARPPSSLREAILGRVQPRPDRGARARPGRAGPSPYPRWVPWALAGLAAGNAALGLGLWRVWTRSAPASPPSAAPESWDRPGEPYAAVLEGTDPTPGARGKAVVYTSRDGFYLILWVEGLPPLPPSGTYRAWLLHDGQRTGAGSLRVDEAGRGTMVFRGEGPFVYQSVGVTHEPGGDGEVPQGRRVLGGSFF